MEILSVALENFKSHQSAAFEFELGTNAICGENGAGKTSILEAIAWTLFNYNSGYQKDEIVRKGAKSAQVTVTFISSQDERTYQVKRCTKRGYEIYDPQLQRKLEHTKVDDVTLWLKEHIGVARNTDLEKLFSETIGIPQGSFTTDFLKGTGDRKKVFDPILKVEEYKQAFNQARDLEKYADSQITELQSQLSLYDFQLKDWDDLKLKHQELSEQIQQEVAELNQLATERETLQQQKLALTEIDRKLQGLTATLQALAIEIRSKEKNQEFLEKTVQLARSSLLACQESQGNYQAYQISETILADLSSNKRIQQEILAQKEQKQTRLQEQQKQFTKLQFQLESFNEAKAEVQRLEASVIQQTELEERQENLEQQYRRLEKYRLEQEQIENQLSELLEQLQNLKAEINRLRKLEPKINQIPELEQAYKRYQEQLSRIEAAKQFQAELDAIVREGEIKCDRFSSDSQTALANLNLLDDRFKSLIESIVQRAETLNTDILTALKQILSDLSQQVSVSQLQQHLQTLQGQLDTAYQCKLEFANIERKLREEKQLKQKAQGFRTRLIQLEELLAIESNLAEEREEIKQKLQGLNNPHGRKQILSQELQRAAEIQSQYERLNQIQLDIEREISQLNEQLAEFTDLETQIQAQQQLQADNRLGYLTYLKHESEANKLPDLEGQLQEAIAQIALLQTQHQTIQIESEELAKAYNPQQLLELETQYETLKNRMAQLEGSLPIKRAHFNELERELTLRIEAAKERESCLIQLAEREKIQQFINDARSFYNQASPRITKFYLDEISREADKLFRELLNRQNVALVWTEDYEIIVQENGYRRGFKSLSGGEQMCAALAVRLALLRVIADIDIAFFDEPTTNMDVPRRRQLADALARLSGNNPNIKTFRQLFVISHDDTFENLSHFIEVKRQ